MTRWSGIIRRVVAEAPSWPGSVIRRALARWRLRPVGDAVMRRRLAAAGLAFPEQAHPTVSVLIAMHGRAEITLNALVSLMTTAREESIEILLCDDHSPDGSGRFFEDVPGLRLTRNRENIGYLRSNNLLAAEARGAFLLLLNNDTVIQPGALSALVDVFRTHADAGLVGARLLFPDGRLQEAGADVLHDGRTVRRGWRQRELPGMYDRIEEVDYCSAAGILIPRRLFLDVGGFDECYLPAYYEDVDLAFKVRAAGKRVYFQPAARIVHVENASSDFARAKAQAAVNRPKFREKWEAVLDAGDHPSARRIKPAPGHPVPRAAAASAPRPGGPKTPPP
jgi:GT2 family glycosyltransferase